MERKERLIVPVFLFFFNPSSQSQAVTKARIFSFFFAAPES